MVCVKLQINHSNYTNDAWKYRQLETLDLDDIVVIVRLEIFLPTDKKIIASKVVREM